MADASVARSDLDIQEDIEDIIVHYPPMVNDRHHVKINIENGVAGVAGSVRTSITRHYLIESISSVKGVARVDDSQLYDDETCRREIGQLIPFGVFANVEYGLVILTGRLAQGTDAVELVQRIRDVPGVRDVKSKFI